MIFIILLLYKSLKSSMKNVFLFYEVSVLEYSTFIYRNLFTRGTENMNSASGSDTLFSK